MELHKALRHIINTEGPEIIKDIRLVNILDDFKAYEDIPASKYILRAIMVDGYANKLLEIGKWDNSTILLTNKFASTTGFIIENVNLIFQSLAYGLGWINNITNAEISLIPHQSKLPYQKRQTILTKWNDKMSEDEKEQYILNLIDFDHSRERELNVFVENLSISVDYNNDILLSFELVRKVKGASASLHYAIYDLKNRINYTSTLGTLLSDSVNHKPFQTRIYGLSADQISKIRLFWD